MNEISFKDFNKSVLINSFSNLNPSSVEASSGKKLSTSETKHGNKSKNTTSEPARIPFKPPGINSSTKSIRKIVAENNLVPYDNEKDTLFSTWTPLSDEHTNTRLYKERKQLFLNWFKTWNENQRRQAVAEMLSICHPRQLFFARDEINKISPIYQIDFTRMLPRVICLYIFSFLDPRSLSRCAQVCWYWKMLTEADQLWMPKCLRFGWNLNYIPTSFENGIWKQFYIENIKALQYIPTKNNESVAGTYRSEINLHDLSYGRFGFNKFMRKKFKPNSMLKQPPWRANNAKPNHFYRFNYLDVDENQIKNEERLMRSLALESAKRPRSSLRVHRPRTESTSKQNHSDLNKSIENLIAEGQTLLDQIKITAVKSDQLNLKDLPPKPKLAETKGDILDLSSSKKDRSDSTSSKQLWNLLDKSDTES